MRSAPSAYTSGDSCTREQRTDSEQRWSVSREQIEERRYDLKAVNPSRPGTTDVRTLGELLQEVGTHQQELESALAELLKAL